MMKFKIGRVQLIITIFIWVLIFFIPLMFGESEDDMAHVIHIWSEYVVVFIIFLINRIVLLPRLFFKNKRMLYFFSVISILCVFVVALYVRGSNEREPDEGFLFPIIENEVQNPPFFNDRPPVGPMGQAGQFGPGEPRGERIENGPQKEFIPPYANLLLFTILLLGFDTGLVFSMKWFDSEQIKIKLEKENVENKMAFLQNQISPHFFMNTLNNIHALVDISSEEAKDAIIKLSRMMGYMLYESQTEKVPLQKEMDFIYSYIELMKIRFTDSVEVVLDIPEELPDVQIPPLLTISFIENAFKHGISYSEVCFVRISFSYEENNMTFDIINKIFDRKAPIQNSGVGLANSKNRLELIYGENYKLEIGELPEKLFAVNLNVPL